MSNTIENIIKLIESIDVEDGVKQKFLRRINEGSLTREENQGNHFCVYFAAIDLIAKKVFIGHHIKSGLWLFNGGHMDKGESPIETAKREISEEWGQNINILDDYLPTFLTITKINNPIKQKCKCHYDVWNFIKVNKNTFLPDKDSLNAEFSETGWKNIQEARELIIDPNTLLALKKIEELFFLN